MRKLTLLLATITLATLVLALPAVPLRADGCGGSGGGGGILRISNFSDLGRRLQYRPGTQLLRSACRRNWCFGAYSLSSGTEGL